MISHLATLRFDENPSHCFGLLMTMSRALHKAAASRSGPRWNSVATLRTTVFCRSKQRYDKTDILPCLKIRDLPEF